MQRTGGHCLAGQAAGWAHAGESAAMGLDFLLLLPGVDLRPLRRGADGRIVRVVPSALRGDQLGDVAHDLVADLVQPLARFPTPAARPEGAKGRARNDIRQQQRRILLKKGRKRKNPSVLGSIYQLYGYFLDR